MKKKLLIGAIVLVVALLLLSSCGVLGVVVARAIQARPLQAAPTPESNIVQAPQAGAVQAPPVSSGSLAALEGTLQSIYEQVSPSVVNIQVLQRRSSGLNLPGFQGFPFNLPDSQQPEDQYQSGSGSGFVWDKRGHIVTNNHVVEGADKIRVTFVDGLTVTGEVIGADPDSDLAVVKVYLPADQLRPVALADSTQVKVGSLAVAIGQPFGLENTMTVGFVSALGRSMPVESESGMATGPSYTIPDVIQTDAPINPGNSGGVLLNSQGQVIGVTSAIISPVRASAGIGFAVPSAIVQKVVPVLIEKGRYAHSWLGISGTSLNPDLAKAMGLDANQRGALVGEVTAGGPADKAGLKGSDRQVTIDGQNVRVGGDVIVAIDGQPIKTFDDLVSYLVRATSAGQKVTLTVLRGGKEQNVTVTLGERPSRQQTRRTDSEQATVTGAYLGITGASLTQQLARAAGLPANQRGILVQEVAKGSPAEKAGLRGGSETVTVGGEQVKIGGDVIVAWNNRAVTSMDALRTLLARAEAGQKVTLTVLRGGQRVQVEVTLGALPGE